jgi:hypothetical protein
MTGPKKSPFDELKDNTEEIMNKRVHFPGIDAPIVSSRPKSVGKQKSQRGQ